LIKFANTISKYINKDRIFIIDYIERGEFYIDKNDPLSSILNILKVQPMTIEQIMDIIKRNKLEPGIVDELRKFVKEVVFNDIKYLVYSGND